MESDVIFNYYRNPACLHYDTVEVKPPLIITGWRRESSKNDALTGWMLQARVIESNFDECSSKVQSLRLNALQKTSQLCAMGQIRNNSIDTCRNSEIGPLHFEKLTHNTHFTRLYVNLHAHTF